ncbi:AcrR family transcriptional regulator [Rhizomicrobium palustre]|uniref:AcrR family transcriptional regulator n=1 Tax=Rhizomicrobium palustre TaxID=189966 RepID=A0A846MVZ3_9PROT|nr:helix-turn-helix domain-containing protein [Rhizomicrobium palustre]NIK87674.1 AcrR family transcriptional regulator [Rhizomicrobium palustre]
MPAIPAKPKRPWQRRKQARAGEILAAAAELAAERGAQNLRMANIAERAGITKGTIYLYFINKEEVLRLIAPPEETPAVSGTEMLAAE